MYAMLDATHTLRKIAISIIPTVFLFVFFVVELFSATILQWVVIAIGLYKIIYLYAMALQQISLFEFFEEPAKKPAAKKLVSLPLPVVELAPIVVDEKPIEVEFKKEPLVSLKKQTRGRHKLSDEVTPPEQLQIPPDEELFEKKYYSIGKVAEMFGVNISLLRFWENEFDILKPKLNGKGNRLFRPEDVKNLKLIYHLIKEKKYTVPGAKEYLKNSKKAEETFGLIEILQKTKQFLHELKINL
jgi:DNA-binding transcriptional MerR regulator